MKIVFIATSRVPSNTANSIQVMKVCQAFVQLGHDIHLLLPQHPDENLSVPFPEHVLGTELASYYGLQVDFPLLRLPANPRWRRYDFAWQAVKRAITLNADVVYAWPPQSALAALIRELPVLFELHEPPSGFIGPLIFRLILMWPGHKRFLPITQVLADILGREHPRFHPENSRISSRQSFSQVISPDGVDLERYLGLPDPSSARQQLTLPEMPTAGYTGHLYPGRGMGLLVDLARGFPGVNFLWVGGRAEDVNFWRNRLAQQGLNNITLTGFIENRLLPLYQAAADILLMPYERRVSGSSGGNTADFCSPMKMFEYMACQRAIISSDLPAISEVLNQHNAFLCPPEDVNSWTTAMNTLLVDPDLRQRIARRARFDVESYTWVERARKALEGFHGS